MPSRREIREVHGAELRVEQRGDGGQVITGYAAVFETLSEVIWGFREKISRGAFTAVLGDDVRALWNHDPNYVLGRTKSGTLRLSQNDVGLRVDVDVPDTTWARDLVESIKRGDVTGQSFAFSIAVGDDEWQKVDGADVRTITKIKRLYDVGPVTYPAYPDTDVVARAGESGIFVPRPPIEVSNIDVLYARAMNATK